MLQASEYKIGPYIAWLHRTKNFNTVSERRTLNLTKPARLLLSALGLGILAQIFAGLLLIYLGIWHHLAGGIVFGVAVLISYPLLWPYLLLIPLLLGRALVDIPTETRAAHQTQDALAQHKSIKIAVTGSYGKTTMKELLLTVLGEGFTVAATPGNKNVTKSHAQFVKGLTGKEDILVIEYGEGAPGDVARFAQITSPTHAVITGLAPAHLDKYKTLAAAGKDIFSVADYLKGEQVYVHGDENVQPFLKKSYKVFDEHSALGWRVSDVTVSLGGTSFNMTKGKTTLKLKSGLIGAHQVAYLSFVAALSRELGMSDEDIKNGIAKTMPFEHRMQPYRLHGAWIIDDTYNGNLEGIRAGTRLLKTLPARRKLYVTPGLVDQGEETEKVHKIIGKLIADAKPDMVVLMQNSVTKYIQEGLKGYKGEIVLEPKPLDFYTNLAQFVAEGDLVLMQNDWPDNYS
jgi:UDP-N-acetylmuramoyl-tripeptide--D-alanyl-D-alanine ligase